MELKTQVKEELLKQREEKIKKEKEINSKLKEITIFTRDNDPISKQYIDTFKTQGVKFIEKNIDDHKMIIHTTQMNTTPQIKINSNYLVHTRDCNNASQAINIIRHFADPDYVDPIFEERMLETLKNVSFRLSKSISNLQRTIQPLVKIMNEITTEIKEEEKSPKKNN